MMVDNQMFIFYKANTICNFCLVKEENTQAVFVSLAHSSGDTPG